MAELRIGLIGYGGWTRAAYVPALRRDGRARIVSAAARSEATHKHIRDELDADVAVFEGFEALLNGPEIHAVMIAVPEEVHAPALSAAIDSGAAIFYEPPVADTRRRIRPMLKRLLAAPQITHADLELSFTPVIARVAEQVRSGAVGRLKTVRIRLQSGWGPIPNADLCTINLLAPWYVDVLGRIIDAHPQRVLVLDGHGTPGRMQSHSMGHFDYEGVWGTFQANTAALGELETHIEVNGDDGDLIADVFNSEIRLRSRRNPDWFIEQAPALEPRAGWPGVHECISAFLDAVESGQPSSTNARAVARLHLVGLAAEASKDSGTWAEVEDVTNLLSASSVG